MGIPYPPSALFLLVIFGRSLLTIELFTWVSKLNERTRALAQQVALLQDRLESARQLPVGKHGDAEEATGTKARKSLSRINAEKRGTETDMTH